MPICRAVILNDPKDKALYYNDKLSFLDNQFFVSNDLLIAPMLEPQSSSFNGYGTCDVYLPAGSDWYAFMDNKWPLKSSIEGSTTVCSYDGPLLHKLRQGVR